MPLHGSLQVPGDKSISHRALIFSSLCPGQSRIKGLLKSADVLATQHCFEAMGIQIEHPQPDITTITSPGRLQEATDILDAQNSGTTIRLLSGLLAAQPFYSIITGDAALRKRPMERVILPLRQMGASIYGRSNNRYAPLTLLPNQSGLQGITYPMPIASAQVKSALLLAGLYAEGPTDIIESAPSRDHTERMLQALGISLQTEHTPEFTRVTLAERQIEKFKNAQEWQVPGDFSSAAFFIAAGLLMPDSCLQLKDVGLNPYRTGLLHVLKAVGAKINIENLRESGGEAIGDLLITSSALKGNITITEQDLPSLIDEVPILTVIGACLDGSLTVTGAEELRKKESDRIEAMAQAFQSLGLTIEVFADGFRLQGNPDLLENRTPLQPARLLSAHHDHRIAMALSILNLVTCHRLTWDIEGREWVKISYPNFFEQLETLNATQTRP